MKLSVLAWPIAAIGLVCIVVYHVLDFLNGHRNPPPVVGTAVGLTYLVVGALIASRRPRNPIGWIYVGALALISFGGSGNVSDQYAYYAVLTHPGSLPASEWVVWAGQVLLSGAFATVIIFSLLLFPDRLYDIDVLINRTLVYGATTVGIGAIFFAGIVVLQAALRPVTSGSEVAVAASTLASFALFQPLRRWIQRGVDRRFYRSRYDAAKTVDEFSVRLRDQVALDAVRADLLDAVRETVQPAHASVWLRGPGR